MSLCIFSVVYFGPCKIKVINCNAAVSRFPQPFTIAGKFIPGHWEPLMNTLRLIIKIKYLQLYGRHLARMLVSLKAARLPECPLPACTTSAPAEVFRSGSPHKDFPAGGSGRQRTFAGCGGEWLYQTCPCDCSTDVSRADQPLLVLQVVV